MSLILASSSPRRQELLAQIGVHFEVHTQAIDETPLADEAASDYVQRLALAKARALNLPDQVVLGADTCVLLDGQILGKPLNAQDARRMLAALSGRDHQVLTAVALVQGKQEACVVVCSQVRFASLSEQQIHAYVTSGEPMDKAGSYAIQGFGAVFIESIQGSYSNVVGLPLHETANLLASFHIPIWQR